MSDLNILLRHNFVPAPGAYPSASAKDEANANLVTTVMMNLSYYGYALDFNAFQSVRTLSDADLAAWWQQLELEVRILLHALWEIMLWFVNKNWRTRPLKRRGSAKTEPPAGLLGALPRLSTA